MVRCGVRPTGLYHRESLLLVFFLCGQYTQSEWCGLEWRAGRDLLKRGQDDRIMFLRLDSADVHRLYSIDGYIEIESLEPSAVATEILTRLRIISPDPQAVPYPNSLQRPTATGRTAPRASTGDDVIDRVLEDLSRIKAELGAPIESQIADALSPLFRRPAFYGIREEDWRSFLYALCRTRLLSEEYAGYFKSSASTRASIDAAIQRMVQLQNAVAALFGNNFSITDHIRLFIANKSVFLQKLPRVRKDPTPDFIDARDREIRAIRKALLGAGVLDSH